MASLPLSPYCTHLASKKSYFNELPPQTDEQVVDGSQHCWCTKTMLAVGPDGDVVGPEDCAGGRECFESRG